MASMSPVSATTVVQRFKESSRFIAMTPVSPGEVSRHVLGFRTANPRTHEFVGSGGGRARPVCPRLPQAEPSPEREGVVPQTGPGRERLQLPGVPAAEDHVVRLEGGGQAFHDLLDMALPLLPPQPLQPPLPT